MAVLMSDWTGLSNVLLASIAPVRLIHKSDDVNYEETDGDVIVAPPSAFSTSQANNWSNPFEHMDGVAGAFPFLSALAQSGALSSIVGDLARSLGVDANSSTGKALAQLSKDLEGTSGMSPMTQLNSVQIFNGSPPMRITMTMEFRALRDAKREVAEPVRALMELAAPRYIAKRGILQAGGQSGLRSVFPSDAPHGVAVRWGGAKWSPFVIDGVEIDHHVPRDAAGNPTRQSVQLSLSSWTALDRNDIRASYQPGSY